MDEVTVIGGGLAGCEAAWQARRLGVDVTIYEMKPLLFSPAHTSSLLAELVCSNSLKSDSLENSSGLLKEEMRLLGSLVIRAAEQERVPAGKSLSVDRKRFSSFITETIEGAGVRIIREEVRGMPSGRPLIIATGPLTSDAFAGQIRGFVGAENLYFYDAISPVLYKDSIDFNVAFMASRYDRGSADYINCPLDRTLYERFVGELLLSKKTPLHSFERMFFEGCMPVETLAERGRDTLAFGPMKPVGIIDPKTGKRPYAVLQLRRENREDTLYNMVGFQTRLLKPEQKRVFSLIPGLENARFARYGSIHRNSFIDSPRLLLRTLQTNQDPSVFFAGQITGVEGYCESAATGIIAGINASRLYKGLPPAFPPPTTMVGALIDYITDPGRRDFQPMNSNFGLIKGVNSKSSRRRCVERALSDVTLWKNKILESSGGI